MGSDDARQLDTPLKCKVTAPMMDTLASLNNLEISNLYADYLVRLAIQIGFGNHATQYLNHVWISFGIFIPRSSHDTLWSHRGIRLCYPTWSCPPFCTG